MKRGKLSKNDKQYIEDHYNDDLSDISDQLDRSEDQVKAYLDVVLSDAPDVVTKPEVKVAPRAPAHDQAQIIDKRTGNVVGTIVTEATSQRADAIRDMQQQAAEFNQRPNHPAIFRPKG